MGEEGTYDLITLGAGSGGTRTSRLAAAKGLKVAVVELPFGLVSDEKTGGAGGTCVIRGCVPKKLLVYASAYASDFNDAPGFGWQPTASPGMVLQELMKKKAAEVERLNGIYKRLMVNAGCDYIDGYGKLLDANTVQVTLPSGELKILKTKNILVATGCRAFVPDIPGKELCVTSDEALVFEDVPKKLCIIGGGYIAVEFAGIYAAMGSEVHVVYRRALPLRGFDEECRAKVAENLVARGVIVHADCKPVSVEKSEGGGLSVTIETPEGPQVVAADQCMFATGRKPNVAGVGLENAGVQLGDGNAIVVNSISQSSVPNIWAIGDVTNRVQLTPVALMEAMALVDTLLGSPKEPKYDNIPCAVFCQPPLSSVGLSEQEAEETHVGEADIFVSSFKPMKHTISGRQERAFMKLVVDVETGKVLGAHMVGPDAPEIMQGVAIALKCGATKAQFDSTVGIHPSSAEEFVTMRTATRRITCKGTMASKI